jgi:branched-subunit amino acid ABC-type transport system permease component
LILAAMGFTLIYYMNGFMNIAYAETITMGAYCAHLVQRGDRAGLLRGDRAGGPAVRRL